MVADTVAEELWVEVVVTLSAVKPSEVHNYHSQEPSLVSSEVAELSEAHQM
jgi:hypothetical protein